MRDDIGNKLVHLTKGTGEDTARHRGEAATNLANILAERTLRGGCGFIKGKHLCVCFSEAPIGKLSQILASKDPDGFKYQPYGILVDKKWLFSKGGRPVIYGPDDDYGKLPDDMKYRHVRFWLSDQYTIDHTWEREWRIKTRALIIRPQDVTVVVPDRTAKDSFVDLGYGDWHYISLSDLGVDITPL
jgi:hypothetical protein